MLGEHGKRLNSALTFSLRQINVYIFGEIGEGGVAVPNLVSSQPRDRPLISMVLIDRIIK
jgi:hypothetical protein